MFSVFLEKMFATWFYLLFVLEFCLYEKLANEMSMSIVQTISISNDLYTSDVPIMNNFDVLPCFNKIRIQKEYFFAA